MLVKILDIENGVIRIGDLEWTVVDYIVEGLEPNTAEFNEVAAHFKLEIVEELDWEEVEYATVSIE